MIWTRISLNACGKGTYRSDTGWTIEHCGHPTALWPYALFNPAGEMILAVNGRAHQTVAAAKAFAEDQVREVATV